MNVINKTAEKTLYLVCRWNRYGGEEATGDWNLEIQSWEPGEDSSDIVLDTFTVSRSISLPHESLVKQQLTKYDSKEKELNRDFGREVARIDDLRQQLLALPHLDAEEEVWSGNNE